MSRLSDVVFEYHHCISNIVGRSLDVVRCRRAHTGVSENSLNHHIRHSEAIQVASQSSPGSVPTVPLRDAAVTIVSVVCFLVVCLCLSADFASIQGEKNDTVDHATKRQRFAHRIGEDRANKRVRRVKSMHF